MSKLKFTDGDVLDQLMEHLDYENNVLGISPTYVVGYQPTPEELKDRPKSPLLNW
jgi:hypothetical protein